MERYQYEDEQINCRIIFYYNKSIVNINITEFKGLCKEKIFNRTQLIYKEEYKKYFSDFHDLINQIKIKNIIIKLEEKTSYESNKNNINLNDDPVNKGDIKYLILTMSGKIENEPKIFININIYVLNLEYYLTTGLNIRENEKPFLSYLKRDKFNQEDILEFLEKENILSVYNVDCMRYFNPETKVFELVPYEKVNIGKKLTLEIHYNKKKDPILTNFKDTEQYINQEIINIKNQINYFKYGKY